MAMVKVLQEDLGMVVVMAMAVVMAMVVDMAMKVDMDMKVEMDMKVDMAMGVVMAITMEVEMVMVDLEMDMGAVLSKKFGEVKILERMVITFWHPDTSHQTIYLGNAPIHVSIEREVIMKPNSTVLAHLIIPKLNVLMRLLVE